MAAKRSKTATTGKKPKARAAASRATGRGRAKKKTGTGRASGATRAAERLARPPVPTGVSALTRGAALPAQSLAVGVARELRMEDASRLVRAAAHDFSGSLETTLEAAGLITSNQRAVFAESLRVLVHGEGFELPASAIPTQAGTRLREVRDALLAGAR